MATVRYNVHFGRVVKPLQKTKDWKKVKRVEKDEPKPAKSKDKRGSAADLLALAHFVERGLNDGSIRNFAEAVALLGIDRSRLSQIMKLLDLNPSVQEDVIHSVHECAERSLRKEAAKSGWQAQRMPWPLSCDRYEHSLNDRNE